MAGSVWLPAKIVESTGPVSFHVVLEDGRNRRCHQDQLRPWVVDDGPPEMSEVSVDAEGEAPPITTTPVTLTSGSTLIQNKDQNSLCPQSQHERTVEIERLRSIRIPVDILFVNARLEMGSNLERTNYCVTV